MQLNVRETGCNNGPWTELAQGMVQQICASVVPKHEGCPVCSVGIQQTEVKVHKYRGADKSLARPTSKCILFDGENTSFDDSLVLYI